jgi:hypothetical protein
MIPFANTWPYEVIRQDIYVESCPFCRAEKVILPLKQKDLQTIHEGKKHMLVFPCCHGSVRVVDADRDYLLADRKLR